MLRSSLSRSVLQRCERIMVVSSSLRSHSSKAATNQRKKEISDDGDGSTPKQPFVTSHLEPGEWDGDRKDPFYRPKIPKRSGLISAEDFANRPPVAFENEFSSYTDAMISLSWLDSKTCRQIYQVYVDMMVLSQQQHSTTSHEYVTRVIAQKFNLTTSRTAAVIQLQHSEEQMRQHNPELLCEEQAQYAEEAIKKNIKDAYRADRSSPPSDGFMEDPVGIHGRGEMDETSKHWTTAEDMYDLEQKLEEATIRDAERSRVIIDGHVFKEDADESTEEVYTDANCRRLLKAQKEQKSKTPEDNGKIPFPETDANGEKRSRWKYVAKVVNTRAMKKKGRRIPTYTNNNMSNTLVEEDGSLRVATVEEAKQVAWKPTRDSNEYIYAGAKKAWLEKTLHGKTNVWGRAPPTRASEKPIKKQDEDKKTLKAQGEEEAVKEDDSDAETKEEASDEKVVEEKDSLDGQADDDKEK